MKIQKNNDKLERFFQLIKAGQDAWKDAGKLLIELVKEDEDVYEKIIARADGMITVENLETLERFGRGLDPAILLSDSPGCRRLLRSHLEPSKMTDLASKPIAVVVLSNGGTRVEYKAISELTQAQAEVSIGNNGARSVDAQTEIIRENEAKRVVTETMRYRIDDGKVTFFAHSTFTLSELVEIESKLKPTANELQTAMKRNQI